MNVLITAASRKVALVNQFKKVLNGKGRVLATDMDPLSPALHFSDGHYIVPMSKDPEYLPLIKDICIKESIKLLIPTIDEELLIYADQVEEFALLGVTVLVATKEAIEISNDKYRSYHFFSKNDITCPTTLLPNDIDFDNVKFPLFVKPRFGRGSINSFKVRNEKELCCFIDIVDEPIVQEFISGTEYTIDILSDLSGNVLSVVPRERIVIRAGVSDRGRTLKDQRLIDYAVDISLKLGLTGPNNIQCIVTDESVYFLEVNPRFSGGIQLTFESGADFADMILRMVSGENVVPCIGDFKSGLVMTSYEKSIFL